MGSDGFMGMDFLLGAMKTSSNELEVVIAQPCELRNAPGLYASD